VKVSNQNDSKPPQFSGKKSNDYLMWNIKFKADMVVKVLWDTFQLSFEQELPAKEVGPFNLSTED
jgi:hypothetical protein